MRKMDKNGLFLCNLQGNVFASSLEETKSSSEIFIRRFMLSDTAKGFDSFEILNESLTDSDIFSSIENEFGETSYGKIKYNKEVLFWIGYLYRYMAYVCELSSKSCYKIIKPKELNKLYYVYHTFDCMKAVETIFELKNISFDTDRQNEQLLKMLRKKRYEKDVIIADIFGFIPDDKFKDRVSDNDEVYTDNGYLYFSIQYKGNNIGEIKFKKDDSDFYKLEILIKNEKYQNKGLGSVALNKALDLAKEKLSIYTFIAKIEKKDERSIHFFAKAGFIYKDEDADYAYYIKANR